MPERSVAEKIELARNVKRPTVDDYVAALIDDFCELHGDRRYGDDRAVCAGVGTLSGVPVTVIGHRKGKDTKSNIACNFGMPRPEGYRKALRLMQQAEKFGRAVLFFVDTPGAHCDVGAEERGQGEAIAACLYQLSSMTVPVITVITGEGGSGGALAFGVANEVYMLENAVYSVISPKGMASILWKDPLREKEAAEMLRMTADDLKDFGVIDGIIPEPEKGAHTDPRATLRSVKKQLTASLARLSEENPAELKEGRYRRFRCLGVFAEESIKE